MQCTINTFILIVLIVVAVAAAAVAVAVVAFGVLAWACRCNTNDQCQTQRMTNKAVTPDLGKELSNCSCIHGIYDAEFVTHFSES